MRLTHPAPVLALVLLAAACSSSSPSPSPEKKADGTKGADAAAAAAARPPASDQELAERDALLRQSVAHLTGAKSAEPVKGLGDAESTVTDPETGRLLTRIEKSNRTYSAQGGALYNAVLGMRPSAGVAIVKEDEKAWYVAASTAKHAPAEDPVSADDPNATVIVSVDESEGEVVQPKTSSVPLHFEESSAGLPTNGMWRENFAVGDLDGDGKAEIVAPAPRLSGRGIEVFRFDGKGWSRVPLTVEAGDTAFSFEYGGVALSDLDGDGKLDIVYGQHGAGVKVLKNLGGMRFRVERRGLPPPTAISSRAVAAGDVDGDGRPDIVVLSDDPQNEKAEKRDDIGDPVTKFDPATGDLPGWNLRFFRQQEDGNFAQENRGLGWACFGYSVALQTKPVDGGKPILAASCHLLSWFSVLFEYDKGEKSFKFLRDAGLYEGMGYHAGVATGSYHGYPAAYVTYLKGGPKGAEPKMSGQGLSIYYRTGDGWKRKRVFKEVADTTLSRAVAVGDLDGDGLDDVVFADERARRVRIFFQTASGDFEELDAKKEPKYVNSATSVRLFDVDGDGRLDIVLMTQYYTGSKSRSGGLRFFSNRRD